MMRSASCTRFLIGVAVAVIGVRCAHADIKRVTNNSYVNGVVPGTVTNDLSIDFAGQYTGSQLRINLKQGSMYQHSMGSATAPIEVFTTIVPAVKFDSFLAQGSQFAAGPFGHPSIGPNAVNLGSAAGTSTKFDSTGADMIWWPAGGMRIEDQEDFMTARLTLSSDAQGTWSYMSSAGKEFGVLEQMPIVDGRLMVDLPYLGDYNDDALTGQKDLDLVLLNWGETAPPVPSGWVNEQPDGLIGQGELDQVLVRWGNGAALAGNGLRWTVTPVNIDPADTGGAITSQTGDFNGSGKTEQADLDLFLVNYGKTSPPVPEGWVNQQPEGVIAGCSYCDAIFLNWGESVEMGASGLAMQSGDAVGHVSSLPEPSSLLLISLSISLLITCRFRSRVALAACSDN